MRLSSFALLLSALLVAAQPACAAPEWPQSQSDLKPDPAVRFGVLPNGTRYAILRNATPKGQASLRLRIGAGSLDERDAEQGVAHLLEHMAFKGSAHVPAGQMIPILERKGLRFGPDTNASTSWTETVYQLDLPETDADTVDTALMLMREQAGELSLTGAALEPERSVVLSEERLRDTPGYRASKAHLGFWLKGERAPERFPIGKVEVIKSVTPEALKAFYSAHYRPENATLIAVGDFDPAEMEAKIRARFSDWRGVGPAGAPPPVGSPGARKTEALVTVQPGAGTSIQIAWAAPYDDSPDTLAKQRREMIEQLGFSVLNRRLQRLARSPKPPFLNAGAGRQNVLKSARLAVLSVSSTPDGWREALDAAERARRQAVQFGVNQAELDREILETRTSLEAEAAGAATRRTPALADALAHSVEDEEVFTSPAQDVADFDDIVRGLKAEAVSSALRRAFAGAGPLVSLTTPTAVDGGETTLAAAFAEAESKPVLRAEAVAAKPWPYTRFGSPGVVAERREIADLGATQVRFANGVRLTVKPTAFRKDQVLVEVRVGHGLLGLSRDQASPTWASRAVIEGGLGKLTTEEIDQTLADRVAGANLGVDEDAFELSGSTRPADLGVQLQLLTAYLTDPAFRPEAFERSRSAFKTALDQLDATPQGVLNQRLAELEHAGDARWRFPTRAALDVAKPEDARALFGPALAGGPIEVIVTGDVTVEAAIASVGATLGALPPRVGAPVPERAREVRFPAAGSPPVTLMHKGRADQAEAYVAWPAPDLLTDHRRARRVRLLEQVLQLRLIDEVRTKQGATYSPNTGYDASEVFPGYGFISVSVETPPAKLARFDETVAGIVADLAAKGPTPDELERARRPRIEAVTKARQTNEYWRAAFEGAWDDPRRLESVRGAISDLQAATVEDVRREAAELLRSDRALRVRVTAAP